MTSTDSESTDSYKNDKSNKKRKRKSERKHKKNKKEKRKKHRKRTSDTDSSYDSEITKKKILKHSPTSPTTNVVDESFGPVLPPHLLKFPGISTTMNTMIGPVLPSSIDVGLGENKSFDFNEAAIKNTQTLEEHDTVFYGPMPITTDKPLSSAQRELEQRALELKLAAIGDSDKTKTTDQKVREEWMLELPDVGLKGGLAALSNLKRTFHQGKEKPDFSDRSDWTKTPTSDNKSQTSSLMKNATKTIKEDAQEKYDKLRDEEQERIAKKHKKKHKRDESLVELHQKKLRKEQKKKEKELAATGAKPERRPFSRDVDLKLNKIDRNQTKSIVEKAKILNTKFSSGHTKYL